MPVTIDHVFVMCAAGAPEASALTAAGLREASSNTHPGQGTANRRFFFENAYVELLWVSDAEEARREPAARTRLWDRWSRRGRDASPFGLVFAGVRSPAPEPPFPTWSYHAPYSELAIDIAVGTPLSEPELVYLRFVRPPDAFCREPTTHELPLKKLTTVSFGSPGSAALSAGARAAVATGLVTFRTAEEHVMTLAFDGAARRRTKDLRPVLPLVLAW